MDIKHHTVERGEGELLILLHGNGENGRYFKHQLSYFSKRYHVIAIDTRGHGETPRGEAPFSIGQFADDLLGFMDERKIEKAHILGFSDGGNIAILFALRYPERVDRLILNGANLRPGGVKVSFQIPTIAEYIAVSLKAGKNPEAKARKELLALMVKEPQIDWRELSAIKNKTLVIAGTDDVIRESHTRLIYRSLPNAQLALLEGDHFIARRKAEAFNKIVEEFLQ